jgi:hypothetical protein
VDISGYWKDKCFGYPKDILSGYFIWIQTDIPGYHMDIIQGYEWISLRILEGYLHGY